MSGSRSGLAESIRVKLKNHAKQNKLSMDFILLLYVNQRLLGRLEYTDYKDRYCLKGGNMLAALNNGNMFRPTQDLDLDGAGDGGVDDIVDLVEALASVKPVSEGGVLPYDDGLDFDMSSMKVRKDRDAGDISGGKVEFDVVLGKTKIRARMDVGFGNPIIPNASLIEYPSLLVEDKKSPIPAPKIMMYSTYSAAAEKVRILAEYGEINTRIRDYYDLYFYFTKLDLQPDILAKALDATFRIKNVDVPEEGEEWGALSEAYVDNNTAIWERYMSNGNMTIPTPDFPELIEIIKSRIEPAMKILRENRMQEDYFFDIDDISII